MGKNVRDANFRKLNTMIDISDKKMLAIYIGDSV